MTQNQPEVSLDDLHKKTDFVCTEVISCNRRDPKQVLSLLNDINALVKQLHELNTTSYLSNDESVNSSLVSENMPSVFLERVQKFCNPWLVSVLNKPPSFDDLGEEESNDQLEYLMDTISEIMCILCGKTASGPEVTKFTLERTGTYNLRETSYTEAEIGFQTWGGGILLAKYIDEGVVDVRDKNVLELGCGTGLAGLVSGRAGAKVTVMTDYHPVVLDNAQLNVDENNLQDVVKVKKLDWFRCHPEKREQLLQEEPEDPLFLETEFEMVIAADCIFALEHSYLVPKVAKHYLAKREDARFHVLIPMREKFKIEVASFFENMEKEGWIEEKRVIIEKVAINFRYSVYHL